MVVPVISSATISSSSITTEQTATITCAIADTPIYYAVKVNSQSFLMRNTTGNNYELVLKGSDVGVGTTLTITIVSLNALGEGDTDTSLALTVSLPTRPSPVEDRVIDRILLLMNNNVEGFEKFTIIKTKTKLLVFKQLQDAKNMPFLWIHPISATPKYASSMLIFDPLNIEMKFAFDFQDNIDNTLFNQIRESVSRLIERNPHLKYGNDVFQVYEVRLGEISYPSDNNDGIGTINLLVKTNLENVQ